MSTRAATAAAASPLRRGGLASRCQPMRSLAFTAGDARLAVHVASRCRQASSTRGTRAMATMAKKSVGDLTEADLEGKRVCGRLELRRRHHHRRRRRGRRRRRLDARHIGLRGDGDEQGGVGEGRLQLVGVRDRLGVVDPEPRGHGGELVGDVDE